MPRILVVDDDDDVREMVRQMLLRAGYEVSVAANGKEGIEVFQRDSPHLVVLDIVMPEKEGLETNALFKLGVCDLPLCDKNRPRFFFHTDL